MRVNLITATTDTSFPGKGALPLSLTIKPSCGMPGDYEYATDSAQLMLMLREQTDLPTAVLQRFEVNLWDNVGARLLGVELSERVLTEIGYFVD